MIFFDVTDAAMEETVNLRNGVELATSVSDKHLDLLRPSARSYPIFRGDKFFYEIDNTSMYQEY